MKKLFYLYCLTSTLTLLIAVTTQAQIDSVKSERQYKNVIRYNLSGAMLFGFDKYLVLGYERVIKPQQSISINFGRASLPKLVTINTDSLKLEKDQKNSGFNFSIDYRFYLAKENRHAAPRGVYIGPYYAYSDLTRDNQWTRTNSSGGNTIINTQTKLKIHTVGFELGYQFILWKRLTLDFVLAGPGLGFYDYKAKFDGTLDPAKRDELLEALRQLLLQKFPGMNFVFADKEISANGVMKTTTIGYRYIIHIGFNF